MQQALKKLKAELDGDLFTENVQRVLYSTDASQYKELPLAVARPKNKEDIKKLLAFAKENGTSIIPRGAGTSLAGQVVGSGIVVDISKYMNRIIDIDVANKTVVVEPGVVLAELNQELAKHDLQFGPETSTANRCVIGGMLGNNSCGLHSLVYGSVRDHILEIEALLHNGSEVKFAPLSKQKFADKCNSKNQTERAIYRNIAEMLSSKKNQKEIREHFPDSRLTRRNMGYAIDALLDSEIFTEGGHPFNFCHLLAGSEGTLAFSHRIKLNLVPLPPEHIGLVCAHFKTLEESLQGNLVALQHQPTAIELMDDVILECTKENITQAQNRFFVKGTPGAILMIEFACETEAELQQKASEVAAHFEKEELGYHFPFITGKENIKRVWELRKAGLGLLANVPGDKKGVPGIEDAAVIPEYLPEYIADLKKVLKKLGLTSIYYAHIATGEIHCRALINFKSAKDTALFEKLMQETATLVKKHKGSLSGEHGDGRVRGKFIPFMLGAHNYRLFKQLKNVWDPHNIMNPGKITDTPPIIEQLRVVPEKPTPEINTNFDFTKNQGYFRTIEKCNGSGDCRKSIAIGGTMCPTFMASRDESKTTRGRANLLREFFYAEKNEKTLTDKDIYAILALCISCKACKSECPSNVDMAKLKAEFLQKYYDKHGIPLRSRLIAYLPRLNQIAIYFRSLVNFSMQTKLFKKSIGFSTQRNLPKLSPQTLTTWSKKHLTKNNEQKPLVYLFNDEFTNFHESDIGIKAILLLTKLGYEVKIPKHKESSRTFLSKGLLRMAKKVATKNVLLLKDVITKENPLIGIEPSAILAFRDEYPELVSSELQETAKQLSKNALLFEEFIAQEVKKGTISTELFTNERKSILLHGHCQQKAIANTDATKAMLSLPSNYSITEIPSGCCGMAGSFGYEKEHHKLSMQIGEMVLFPAVRKADSETLIAASGTSCRHQIKDGTSKKTLHPIEILYDALLQ